MEFSSDTIVMAILAFVLLAVVVVILGRGRRSSRTTLGAHGVEIETKNEEEGAQTTTIKNVKITGSERTSVKTGGNGSHIEGVEVEDASDTDVEAGKGK